METLRILHIEDNLADAELIKEALHRSGLVCDIRLASSYSEYLEALDQARVDLILSDSRGYDFEGLDVLRQIRVRLPGVPFLFLSGSFEGKDTTALKAEGAAACLLKDDLDALAPAIQRALQQRYSRGPAEDVAYPRGMERLVSVAQELSLALDLDTVTTIVRQAEHGLSSAVEMKLLRALADIMTMALENLQQLRERTTELEVVNHELEAFTAAISHDLRAPLRSISGFSDLLMEEYGQKLDEIPKGYLNYITTSTKLMSVIIDDLIKLARVTSAQLSKRSISLTDLASKVVAELQARDPVRKCHLEIVEGLTAQGDARLITIALENLLGNAWKFTSKQLNARIVFGSEVQDGKTAFYIRDNGAGFDMKYAERLFVPFQRLHREDEFAGTGIGLAIAHRILMRHGGRIWTQAVENQGATFFFTLGNKT